MSEDYLGFEDPTERRAALGPALIAAETRGPRELSTWHDMERRAPAVAREALFTTIVDEVTLEPLPEERWEITKDRDTGEIKDEGLRWQALMAWPRVPTIEEALAAQTNARTACLAEWWDRLQTARALDEKYGWKRGPEDEANSVIALPDR
jgi:hypothetical protein